MLLYTCAQGQIDEAEINERCTIKSHGSKVAREYKHDWFILLVLAALEIGLFMMRPFYRFVGEGMMTDLKYPLKENTVPTWSVGVRLLIFFPSLFRCSFKDSKVLIFAIGCL